MSERTQFVSIKTLFPQLDEDKCRICDRDVREPFYKYCSKYCKSFAESATKFYNWSYIRKLVLQRDDHTCQRCGEFGGEVDHIVPEHKGGHPFAPDNLQTLCTQCNAMKGTSSVDYRGLDVKHITVTGEEIELSMSEEFEL